ncbi:UNVERIFIED_CONTAM: hypothetical protein FKN15_042683 [Acipenser sinensis]
MELCQRMLGLMAAASQALPLGLLHQRPLQAWFNAFALHPRRDKRRRLRVSRTCWEALRWWKVPSNIRQGVRLGPIFRREVITTDASNQGWGAVWNGTGTRGVWSGPWRSAHINALELRAVDLALRHFWAYTAACAGAYRQLCYKSSANHYYLTAISHTLMTFLSYPEVEMKHEEGRFRNLDLSLPAGEPSSACIVEDTDQLEEAMNDR